MSKKTLIIIGCSFIGLLVLLLLIVWLLAMFKSSYVTYEKLEDKIVEATKKYYADHPDLLPVNDGKYSLDYNVLVAGEYIKPLNEMLKDGDKCTADVIINKSGVDYTYVPRLDCGDSYKTVELYRQIINDNPVVTSGSGLYREGNTYYFRGKVTNNYFAMGVNDNNNEKELLWQIISIDSDNTVRIRAVSATEENSEYDGRYNIDKDANYGYNTFEDSSMKDFLRKLETDGKFLTAEQKSKLVSKRICIGKRSEEEKVNNGSVECSALSKDTFMFSTLLPYEFLRASLDENCKTVLDKSCENLNYLASQGSSEWSTTASSTDSYRLYAFYGTYYGLSSASNPKVLHVVANLSEYAFYKSGKGTMEDPYRIFKVSKSTK